MANDAYVQVAPDGSGKKIRNVETALVKADGSEHAVESQVLVPASPDGRLADPDTTVLLSVQRAILAELVAMREMLADALDCDLRHSNAKKGGRHYSAARRTA